MIKKYIVYATMDQGDGHVEKIGEYEDITDVKIRVGMFSEDVVITVEPEFKEDDLK